LLPTIEIAAPVTIGMAAGRKHIAGVCDAGRINLFEGKVNAHGAR
jgi:hypothetical protein